MKDEKDKSSESIAESLKAVLYTVELAQHHGIYDGKLAEAAYYVVEAGLRMIRPDSVPHKKRTVRG